MKLTEALLLASKKPEAGVPELVLSLACGFTPLHLSTFLTAHARNARAGAGVRLETGLFGDLPGNLQRLARSETTAGVVILEWQDIDPRLSVRQASAWGAGQMEELLRDAASRLRLLRVGLEAAALHKPVALALPSLPLPPVAPQHPAQFGAFASTLRAQVAEFAAQMVERGVRVLDAQELDLLSPANARYDASSDLSAGFPYTTAHAGVLAGLLVQLLYPVPPKKGLITDLDDTLWHGILGEIGVEGVAWSLDTHHRAHGYYQTVLESLASSGVLVAVASKNDMELVEQAFQRSDIALTGESVFPVEANWGPKSDSISRILKAWNVGADSVVFIDDSPMELEEVRTAYPAIECIRFDPAPQKVWELARRLRAMFGKAEVRSEDAVRLSSLRQAGLFSGLVETGDSVTLESVLRDAGSVIRIHTASTQSDWRAFELINKTNQFNLNGERIVEGEWLRRLAEPSTLRLVAEYEDRFGPLGKIAVLLGSLAGNVLTVDFWVMSCRAFSRRIEYSFLRHVFDSLGVSEVRLRFRPTDRNGPLREWLQALGLSTGAPADLTIDAATFADRCPALYAKIEAAASHD
jgi:FkbH-like protein